jgi:hypothetical protein
MIEQQAHIKELYDLKHRHDNELHTHYDYENNLLKNLTSNVMYRNSQTAAFMDQLQKLCVWSLESVLIVRNFFNYTVDRYYNRHSN